jgi:high affinity Mn2+ porin
VDGTLFLGVKLWRNGELYLNPELDQGFGLSDTTGMAGFPSGAAYKVGRNSVYGRLQRVFLRQIFALDEELSVVESGPNTLAGPKANRNLTLTAGKFSVVDIFDNNSYAHDPRADFMNWAVIDSAAFDYAADSWGYTYGVAAEWTQQDWTIRGGVFAMSSEPNAETIDKTFGQREWVAELEHRHEWREHRGATRLLVFLNQARMAYYGDAVALAQGSGQVADVNQVRRSASKWGFAINVEQEVAKDLGAFVRVSRNSGNTEAYDFTDVNQSLTFGFSLKGNYWNQPAHTFGTALAVNGLSKEAKAYFSAGGMGILIGDGQLPHYSNEQIVEAYYAVKLNKALTVSGDIQYVKNPAYNADRGPVSIGGLRVHAEF